MHWPPAGARRTGHLRSALEILAHGGSSGLPDQWQLAPRDSVAKQLGVLEGLVRKAELIYHAGDPDREGQLLVDEVLRYFNVRCPVHRVLINDLNRDAVRKALAAPRDNRDFRRLSHSALARQRADWLYGINLTRYYTLSYQQQALTASIQWVGCRPRCLGWSFTGTTPSPTSNQSPGTG